QKNSELLKVRRDSFTIGGVNEKLFNIRLHLDILNDICEFYVNIYLRICKEILVSRLTEEKVNRLNDWKRVRSWYALNFKKLRTFFSIWLKNCLTSFTSWRFSLVELIGTFYEQLTKLDQFHLRNKKVEKPPEKDLFNRQKNKSLR
ncbi:hypothetical protein, partial [Liquorilactobacillus nagelii]|uniref:hypothetical protein n=1 Tax=Liquorilactobacillus nagelii TaxID=82688 RepID=UPI0039E94E25